MIIDSIDYNTQNIKIEFNKDLHLYRSFINNEEIEYKSVTALINEYFKPFDVITVAKNMANKHNTTPDKIIAGWDLSRSEAINYGNKIHDIASDLLLNSNSNNFDLEDSKEERAVFYIKNTVNKIKENFDILGVEKIIFDHNLRIAGTVDFLLKHKNSIIIGDWKTNKEISRKKQYNYGLGPLYKIADNKLNRYTLQLSFYEYLLKSMNYVDGDYIFHRILFHITDSGIVKIHLDDMINNIEEIIVDYLL